MTAPRIRKVENRLAKLARQPGGKTIGEALATAEARIETVREACVASLTLKTDRLAALTAGGGSALPPATLDEIYRLADAIFSLAGAFGLDSLSDAACSLCDLVDRLRDGVPVPWSAIAVHVDGLRLLAAGDGHDADAILAGLRRVRARVLLLG